MSDVDVLVVGGGLAGVAAACQAGRLGARVVLATRGRHLALDATARGALPGTRLAGGLFLELLGAPLGRAPHELEPEPRATAERIDALLRSAEVDVWFDARVAAVRCEGSRVVGATLERGAAGSSGSPAPVGRVDLTAHVTIDASPWGEVLAAARVPTTADTGERVQGHAWHAVEWDATLRVSEDAARHAAAAEADPTWRAWLTGALRPGGRLAVAQPLPDEPAPRDGAPLAGAEAWARAECEARERALWRLERLRARPALRSAVAENAPDVPAPFGLDPEGLALAPRVLRPERVLGCARVDAHDLLPTPRPDGEDEPGRARVRPGAIACGDLGLALATPGPETAVTAAAQVPFGALLPREHDGLLVAGALVAATAAGQVLTRHPAVACQTGQAAGAAAALCAARGSSPRALDVRVLQSYLIDAGAVLFPFLDVDLDSPLSPLLQRLAVRGLFDATTPLEFVPDGRVGPAEVVAFARRWSAATGREAPVRSALAQAGFSRAALATELERLASLTAH